MLEYARLRPGRGFQPLGAALYFGQRITTPKILRRMVSRSIATGVNLRHPGWANRRGRDARERSAMTALCDDGIAMLPDLVSERGVAEMTAFLRTREAIGPSGQRYPLSERPQGHSMVAYALETVLECPGVLRLANHPVLLHLAAAYLGCKPTLSSIGIRWSFPGPGRVDIQSFHRDTDDWRFLKCFLYLTEVDSLSGPHQYVAGSHKRKGAGRIRLYSQETVQDRYGEQSIRTVLGPPGTCFMADTWGLHRGAVPSAKPRLMLQLQYSLLPVFAYRYKPSDGFGDELFDPYVNRLLVRARET
jgi:hypothetical protein